jgi:hypothetical protein
LKKDPLPVRSHSARAFACLSIRPVAVLCALLVGAIPAVASESDEAVDTPRYQSPERSAGGLDTLRGSFEENGAWSLLTDNLRWAVDIAGRVNATNKSGYTNQEFFGIDLLKTVSTEKRDIGTLIVQLFTDFHSDAPPFRKSWDFKVRELHFNYHVTPRGGLNLRVGHMQIPYGLNLPAVTGGTLRQFDTGPNLGHKVDWGTSLNGILPKFVYEVALTRGSGFDYESKGDPYLVSGRIGTPSHRPFTVGASGLHGKVFNPKNGAIIDRTRLGIDTRWQGGPIDALAQVSIGRDHTGAQPKTDIVNSFLDLSWRTPTDALLLYAQGNLMMSRATAAVSSATWTKSSDLKIGAQLAVAKHYWISADYRHELKSTGKTNKPDLIRIELRYRFF